MLTYHDKEVFDMTTQELLQKAKASKAAAKTGKAAAKKKKAKQSQSLIHP